MTFIWSRPFRLIVNVSTFDRVATATQPMGTFSWSSDTAKNGVAVLTQSLAKFME